MRQALLSAVIAGCVIAQVAVNVSQVQINDGLAEMHRSHQRILCTLEDRIGKLEAQKSACQPAVVQESRRFPQHAANAQKTPSFGPPPRNWPQVTAVTKD